MPQAVKNPKKKVDSRKLDEFKRSPQQRAFSFEAARTIDEEARTVEVSFSSDNSELLRWFGYEQLGHNDGEVNLTRLENGGAVLSGHDMQQHIGVVESVEVANGKGRAVVRFSQNARAQEVFQDVIDGIIRHTSVGYFVHEMILVEERDDGEPLYRVTNWEPYEISFVAAGFDPDVGVGRSVHHPNQSPESERNIMTEEERLAAEAAQRAAREKAEQEEAQRQAITVAENKAKTEAREAEQARVNELLAVGEAYKCPELARQCIQEGVSVDVLNKRILEKNLGQNLTQAENPDIGLNEREVKQFSFIRLMRAVGMVNNQAAQEEAAFELECSRAASDKLGKDPRGAFVPYDVLVSGKRDMTVGTASDGGNLVATDLLAGSFIESLENLIALVQCGATMLPGLNGNIAIPRQNGGASHFWLAENGQPTESNATFDQVPMTPKTIGAFTELSRRIMLQSSIGMENFARMELAKRLALGIDLAGIVGPGTGNQPLGIANQPGVGATAVGGTNGGAPTWDHVVDMETDVADANAEVANMCYLTNAKVRGKLKKTLVESGTSDYIWDRRSPEAPLNGYRTVVSNQVPKNGTKGTGTNLSTMIFGNFADVIIGMWGGLDLQVNPFSLDTAGAVRVTAFQDVDVTVRHPESFSVFDDIITT